MCGYDGVIKFVLFCDDGASGEMEVIGWYVEILKNWRLYQREHVSVGIGLEYVAPGSE